MFKVDEKLFEYAETELMALLKAFIQVNTVKTAPLTGGPVDYYDVGESDKVIMIIPSSSGSADVFFRYIQALSKDNRVIVPFYRNKVDLESQYKGFLELLKYLNIKKLNLLGYSFGGIVAQLMVRESPANFDHLILLDSETKTGFLHPDLIKKYVSSYKRLIRGLKYSTNKLIVKSMKKRIEFDIKVGLDKDKHFWEAFYKQVLMETTKESMIANYRNVLEFWSTYELSPDMFIAFRGNVVLLNVAGSISRIENKELKHLFKNTKEVVYDQTFRMALISCFDDIIADISNL